MLIITSYEDGIIEVMIHHVGNGSFEKKNCFKSLGFLFSGQINTVIIMEALCTWHSLLPVKHSTK
jgi:hypothetical protein